MSEPAPPPAPQLRKVRFLVYHQGMGADVGHVLDVDAEWAERAIAAGVVEAVFESTQGERE